MFSSIEVTRKSLRGGLIHLKLDKLLQEEESWEQSYDGSNERDYWEKGVVLYTKLLELDPKEERFRNNLIRCLLELGRDIKYKRTNMRRAQELFKEVVRMEPEHSLACYRLGFLYYYDGKFEEAASLFRKALQRSARYPQHRITDEQAVKALCHQARAYQRLSQKAMDETLAQWSGMPAKLRNSLHDVVEETESQVYSEEQYKPYICIRQSESRNVSQKELLILLESGDVVLNFAEQHMGAAFYLPGSRRVQLSVRPAELLRLLMEVATPIKSNELFETMFQKPMPERNTIIKSNINRIRAELEHVTDPAKPFVITHPEGYMWNHEQWPAPAVVYREDDIYRADNEWN